MEKVMRNFTRPLARSGATVLAALLFAACATDTVTSPTPGAVRGDGTTDPSPPQSVFLCKVGATGTTATFSVTATGGTVIDPTPTANAGTLGGDLVCIPIWNGEGLAEGVTANVTITETAWTPGQKLNVIITLEGNTWTNYGTEDGLPLPENKSVTISVTRSVGAQVYFKNITEDRPPSGKGCTPGYWKQPQHFSSWVGYSPTDPFGSVFENAFPGKSLVDVLGQGGGGLKALGRHTVAALLNASSGVNTQLTTAEVIAKFNAAYPGTGESYTMLKNEFEALNELGCPLD
jgi:hypothetical protein